jgi:hypothetical protein
MENFSTADFTRSAVQPHFNIGYRIGIPAMAIKDLPADIPGWTK